MTVTEVITTSSTTVIETVEIVEFKPKLTLRIKAAPAIRQIYWCTFPADSIPPEMGKERPVIIVSYKNSLRGHSLVLPISTDPQEGPSKEWAHKLSIKVDGQRESWAVCNHLYTVSTVRLASAPVILRLGKEEFDQILTKVFKWLPAIGAG